MGTNLVTPAKTPITGSKPGSAYRYETLWDEWSGRVDSNHRPPGPEPGDSHFAGFCTGMLIFHIVPVQLVSSMNCGPKALHAYALSCRLWLHEKGKKRARFRGRGNLVHIIVPVLPVAVGLLFSKN